MDLIKLNIYNWKQLISHNELCEEDSLAFTAVVGKENEPQREDDLFKCVHLLYVLLSKVTRIIYECCYMVDFCSEIQYLEYTDKSEAPSINICSSVV